MKNAKNMKELAEKTMRELLGEAEAPLQKSLLLRLFFDEIARLLSETDSSPHEISSPNALVEVVDEKTGRLYRRYLELAFHETGNGIRLRGEDIGGKPSEIVFLSNTAIEQIKELQGLGPDSPRCGD